MRNYSTQFNHIIQFQNVTPYLYRYENENHIDDFFSKGSLLLSSFLNYRSYEDNELGDKIEGHSLNITTGTDDKSIGTYSIAGNSAYCFCTSTILDEELKKSFKRNSAFRIVDPINFVLEINRSLNRVHQVLFGNCIYLDQKILTERVPSQISIEQFKDDKEPDKISLDKLLQASNLTNSPDSYFLKTLKYQHQSEYRMIWLTDREVKESLIIDCMEAAKYCERI